MQDSFSKVTIQVWHKGLLVDKLLSTLDLDKQGFIQKKTKEEWYPLPMEDQPKASIRIRTFYTNEFLVHCNFILVTFTELFKINGTDF